MFAVLRQQAAIALFLKAEVRLVAEAAFQHTIWWQGLQPLTDLATLKIIRATCPRRWLGNPSWPD